MNHWLIGMLYRRVGVGADDSMGRVRSDFEAFLTKWSANIGDGKRRERFLYNNYSLISTVLSVNKSEVRALILERGW